MADIRALLNRERTARRIQHEHASYSTTGTLLCTVCHLQLKSETLWDGHLRSAGHITQARKLEGKLVESNVTSSNGTNKKRKASSDEEEEIGTLRKRAKPAKGLPEGFFDQKSATPNENPAIPSPTNEIQIPSRPATPSKPVEENPTRPEVNEDEWAAFEADIATAEAAENIDDAAVISAPAMSATELAAKDREEENKRRRERQEAEQEGDKEDAVRKLEDEFEEMEGLEQRVRKLQEKREALRAQKNVPGPLVPPAKSSLEEEGPDDDEDEEDDWGNFGRS